MRPEALSARLLESAQELPPEVPRRRWAYPAWGIALVSLFIAYHTTVLLVWNTPSGGLGNRYHQTMLKALDGRGYFTATSNTQSWSMFAPNPNRTNVFIRVLVKDQEDEIWDLGHDIWEVDRFPYWFYDRMGKVNRRIDGKKGYQMSYGAWMCREWARNHGGELPKSVQFIKRWTRIPTPKQVIGHALKTGEWGYDPWKMEAKQKEQETVVCRTTIHAQLPNHLRERYGLEPLDDDGFRPLRIRTWWDKAESERKRDEAKAKREDAKEAAKDRPTARFERKPLVPEPGDSSKPDRPG